MGSLGNDGRRKQLLGSAILLLTAIIWGMAFTAQSAGMEYVGPSTYNCLRSILGGLVLLPVVAGRNRRQRKKDEVPDGKERRATLRGGIFCGILLALGSTLQQIGICYTTVGKAGFITALYIIMVPIAGIFFRRRPAGRVWISVAMAAVGIYLLCMTDALTVNPGDLYVFGCAMAFTAHILVIDRFSEQADGIAMSCIQFFVCAVLCGILMLLTERPTWDAVRAAWLPILYAGIFSSGVGYTLQILGQRYTEPVLASLLLSLESVFAALGGWLLLGQGLTGRELVGCGIVFAAILLIQLPQHQKATEAEI